MRIVDRKTFLALPKGTIYAKFKPMCFDGLEIKDEPRGSNDWWNVALDNPGFEGGVDMDTYWNIIEAIQKGEPSPPIDLDTVTADGLYDADQQFAVWERADVEALIARFQRALAEGYSQ